MRSASWCPDIDAAIAFYAELGLDLTGDASTGTAMASTCGVPAG
jgi:hypothetical protein